jgi:hypothetical protein
VNSIPKLHIQYDIKMIVILEDFPKLIAETLNSFFSKLVNNEIRLYRTQPTICKSEIAVNEEKKYKIIFITDYFCQMKA